MKKLFFKQKNAISVYDVGATTCDRACYHLLGGYGRVPDVLFQLTSDSVNFIGAALSRLSKFFCCS